MKPTNRWQLVNYLDVWGNKKDGWEVNNLYREDKYLEDAVDKTDEELINWLKEINFLVFQPYVSYEEIIKRIDVWSDGGMIEFSFASDMQPICRLERVYE